MERTSTMGGTMKYILDSSAWYAFISENDHAHEISRKFLNKTPQLIVLFSVFEELLAVVHKRKGAGLAKKYVGGLLELENTEVIWFDERIHKEIWKMYKNSPNYIDYVDCSVVWYSQKTGYPIFGFDKHFKRIRANIVPK